jgi:hypothetical protein
MRHHLLRVRQTHVIAKRMHNYWGHQVIWRERACRVRQQSGGGTNWCEGTRMQSRHQTQMWSWTEWLQEENNELKS